MQRHRVIQSIVISLAMVLLQAPHHALAQEKLTIALDENYSPYSFVAPGGKASGLLVAMWELWSQETGIPVQFLTGTWEETLEMMQKSKADVHAGLFINETRSQWLSFSSPIHAIKTAFFYRASGEAPKLQQLEGKQIGVVRNTFQQSYIRDKFPQSQLTTFPNTKALLTGLVSGQVDILFDEVLSVSQVLSSTGWSGLVFRSSEGEITNTIHAAVPKGKQELIEQINDGFNSINPMLLASIDKHWISTAQNRFYHETTKGVDVELTDKEKAFLIRHKTISLASTPNWPPFEMEQADGSYAGISADFMRLAAAKVGLSIAPSFDSKWDAQVDKLKNKELDAAPGLNTTPQRREHFTFTTPYIEYYSAIFTRADRTDIKTPEDLKGKTVALEEGYAIARSLPTDRPDITMLLVGNTQQALEAVSTGKADAYIGNQVVAAYLIKKFTLPDLKLVSLWRTDLPGQLRFAVHKDRPILRDILQKGLGAITKKEREAILATYLDASGFQQHVFSLSQAQWAWLKAHPKITLGVDPAFAPLEFIDQQGELQGISSEYVSFIADKLKVDMPIVKGLGWNEVLKRAEAGSLDMVTSIARSPSREKHLLFTEPYIEFPIVVFSRKEARLVARLDELSGDRIAVVNGYVAQEFLSTDYPDISLVPYPTVEEAVNALTVGEVDWLVNDVATGSYAIEKQGLTNLKISTTTDYVMSLAMAVRKDMPELVGILNKALGVVSEEQAAEFKGKWLALKFEHGLDMKTVLTWVIPIAGGGLLILILVVLWNRKLGGEIAQREKAQAELAKTLETLDEKNDMLEGLSSKLAKYLSPQVYDSIFSGSRDVTLSTERKKLTVFFSDIKDFTQTTDDMQPEDLTALLNSYFTEMSAIALEYGATIDKFIGDAMLMFFGDPETQGVKRDAELCVRMAVAMQKRMVELEQEWHAQGYDRPFKMRVGINTGYCNVGNFGSEDRMDYTIIGGEVNLAARLEGQADPGGILMSSETQALVKDVVRTEERPPISVKGIRRSILPHAVISLCDDPPPCPTSDRRIEIKEAGIEFTLDIDLLPAQKRAEITSRLDEIVKLLKTS